MTAALDCGGMSCLSFAPAVGVTTTKEKHHDKTNSSRVPGRERPGGQRPQSTLDRSWRRLATQERCRLRPGHPDRHGCVRPHRLHAAERRQDRKLRPATPVRVDQPVPAARRSDDYRSCGCPGIECRTSFNSGRPQEFLRDFIRLRDRDLFHWPEFCSTTLKRTRDVEMNVADCLPCRHPIILPNSNPRL